MSTRPYRWDSVLEGSNEDNLEAKLSTVMMVPIFALLFGRSFNFCEDGRLMTLFGGVLL